MLIPVLLGVSFLVFAIAQITPGDPARLALGPEATDQEVQRLREKMGLNDPFWVQFGRYVWNVLHGDLGRSIRGGGLIRDEIGARLASTLELTIIAMVLATFTGVTAGVIAATAKRPAVDGATMVAALIGLSVPNYWLGIVMILLLGVRFGWISVTGGEGIKHVIVPALVLAAGPAAVQARLTRSSVLEVMRDDYVRTAQAKGLGEQAVVVRHVLSNALIPVVTVMGLQFAALLGGALFVENVFARPGLGRYAVSAVQNRDYPAVQATVLLSATVYALLNLGVDILYAVLDPRIRYE
jgi:peptide/nickel transport system permease protein